MTLRRVPKLEILQYGMRISDLVTDSHTILFGGTISLSCSMHMGLMMLGRKNAYSRTNST